jgi:hypothetical protein
MDGILKSYMQIESTKMKNSEQSVNGYHTEQIWQEYHTELHRFIQNRVIDISDTDDVLQEVFMEIYNRPDLLKKRNAIQNWIYSITRRVILNHYCDFDEIEKQAFLSITENTSGGKLHQQFTYILLPVCYPKEKIRG